MPVNYQELGREERPFRAAALIAFLSGHALVWPSLVLYLVCEDRGSSNELPILLGQFFLQSSDWLTAGFVLACLCFTVSIFLQACDAMRTRRDRLRAGAAFWVGRVLLSITTCAILLMALFHVALNFFFPTEFQRLTPTSESGCRVVLETHTGMASQSGRLLLQAPSRNTLIDTGIVWNYDDGRLIDPEWVLSWHSEEATLLAPEGVSFQGTYSPDEAKRTVLLACE